MFSSYLDANKLRAWCETEITRREQQLGSGVHKTLEAYREQVGYINGLKDTLTHLSALEKDQNQPPERRQA